MHQHDVTYRLPDAAFPLRFEMLGEAWELQVAPVENGTFWTAQFLGHDRWHLTHAADQERLERVLRIEGVTVAKRTYVATLLMRLEQLGIAERIHTG